MGSEMGLDQRVANADSAFIFFFFLSDLVVYLQTISRVSAVRSSVGSCMFGVVWCGVIIDVIR